MDILEKHYNEAKEQLDALEKDLKLLKIQQAKKAAIEEIIQAANDNSEPDMFGIAVIGILMRKELI
jgi:ferritin-like metal-binding protein YciE